MHIIIYSFLLIEETLTSKEHSSKYITPTACQHKHRFHIPYNKTPSTVQSSITHFA